jgi:PKHD-type hydroxylase
MRLTNEFFYFIDAITPEKCDEIIELGHQLKFTEGTANTNVEPLTGEERKTGRKDIFGTTLNRNSGVVFTDNQDLYDLVFPLMFHANKEAGWDFDIMGAESPQITQYKVNQFYNWHADGNSDRFAMYTKEHVGDNVLMLGNVRKLSMTILLNDDYEGGKLQFKSFGPKHQSKINIPPITKKGSVVVFPSSLVHRVIPVTKGVRYSVVVWFLGPPFK